MDNFFDLIVVVFTLALIVGVFTAGRALVLWYFRLGEIVDALTRIDGRLKKLIEQRGERTD